MRMVWLCSALLALTACAGMNGDAAAARATDYAAVDIIRDCDKPYFDKRAPDGHVILQGMSEREREVCQTRRQSGSDPK
jgi:hypothetical protein